MARADAMRTSVLLVDGVDPDGDGVVVTNSRGVELWWREANASGVLVPHMMRMRIDFHWGVALGKLARTAACRDGEVAFISMRTTASSPPPIPPGTQVLVRLLDLWGTPGMDHLRDADFEKKEIDVHAVKCQHLGVDLHHGIPTPTQWPEIR